jgi:hypothetical protein
MMLSRKDVGPVDFEDLVRFMYIADLVSTIRNLKEGESSIIFACKSGSIPCIGPQRIMKVEAPFRTFPHRRRVFSIARDMFSHLERNRRNG